MPQTAIPCTVMRGGTSKGLYFRAADLPADVPVVTLATAHPAKFGDAVEAAIGTRAPLPERIAGLMEREERYATLPATFEAVTAYVAERARPRA